MMAFSSPKRGAALLLGAALASPVPASTQLAENQTSDPFSLAPDEARAFFLDVPEGASHLKLLLDSARAQQRDVDLFVRFAEPFSESGNPFAEALYYAIGETAVEHLEITYASSPPLSPGRWHVLVYNPTESQVVNNIELTTALEHQAEPSLEPVELDIVYTDKEGEGFKSQGAFAGQGRNNASQLGEARKAALDKAVAMLEESFTSPVAVTVEARFEKFEEDENGGAALASAGPTRVFRDFPGARTPDTWYAGSIVPRLTGTDNCRVSTVDCREDTEADMVIKFNSDVDWWYGFDRDFGNNGFDFIAVAVHEMLHGLGFLTFVDVESGTLFCGKEGDPFCRESDAGQRRTDAYLSQLAYHTNDKFRPVDQLSDEKRLEAFTSIADLVWNGEYGDRFWDLRPHRQPKPPMYAPREINPGSSVSHVGFPDIMFFRGDPSTNNEDLNIREGGPALGAAWYLLRDAGWDEDPKEKLEGPPAEQVPRGMWYDRARNGHGFDFQRVGDNWFLVFFTYDDTGNPEWYLAVGTIEDGEFNGDLQRFTYDENDPDGDGLPQAAEAVGSVELDLDADAASTACNDGVNRDSATTLARFSWEIGEQSGDWCAEPLQLPGGPATPDFSGHWYAGEADQGWGMTIQVSQRNDGSQVLVDTLYFYDDEGNPRWTQGVAPDFINNHSDQVIDMQQFDGYARGTDCTPETCSPADDPANAGRLRLRLQEPVQGEEPGSRATLNVDYLGPESGSWLRKFQPIEMLSDPA